MRKCAVEEGSSDESRISRSLCFCFFPWRCLHSVSTAGSGDPAHHTRPDFSIWSTTDNLTDSETTHWTGAAQPIAGIARIDGKSFRFMGHNPESIPAMEQSSTAILPTHTHYEFRQGGVELEFTFFTPAIMSDLDLLSRPVTYLTWRVSSTDGAAHRVSVLLDVDPVIAVNDRSEQVVSFRNQTALLNVLSVGSRDQNILNRSGDDLRIDWGYFHLAIPRNEDSTTVITSGPIDAFAAQGKVPASDSIGMPQSADSAGPHLAAMLNFGSVGASPPSVTCLSLIPTATPFNICNGISGHTGSATI